MYTQQTKPFQMITHDLDNGLHTKNSNLWYSNANSLLLISASLRTQWSNLHDDKKFGIKIAVFVLLFLMLADVQNQDGFLQAVLLPIMLAVMNIMYEIFSCFMYCLVRPLVCTGRCLVEVCLALLEMFFAIVVTPVEIMKTLIFLPYTVLLGLLCVASNAVSVLLRTVLPLFVLIFFLSPEIRQRCHAVLAQLQHNQRPDAQIPNRGQGVQDDEDGTRIE